MSRFDFLYERGAGDATQAAKPDREGARDALRQAATESWPA